VNTPIWAALSTRWTFVVGFAILGAVAWQSLNTRNENSALAAALQRSSAGVVSVGDWIDDLTGTRADTRQTRYRTTGRLGGSLIVAMSVDCGFCEQNLDAWRRLSLQARQLGLQVVWVSRDTLRRADAVTGLDTSLIADPTHSTYVQLKLSTVPQTVVLQNDGTVTDARAGLIDASIEQIVAKNIRAVAAR